LTPPKGATAFEIAPLLSAITPVSRASIIRSTLVNESVKAYAASL